MERYILHIFPILMICGSIAWLIDTDQKPQPPPDEITRPERVSFAPDLPSPKVSSRLLEEPEAREEAVAEKANPLMDLIPDWLIEQGELNCERIQIEGQWVERVRSRYSGPEGQLIEVEISDLSDAATEAQFVSLGFDLELVTEETERTTRLFKDGEDYLVNMEYDNDDQAGHIQFIANGRYMMEIQLQGYSFESFQEIEDQHALFQSLLGISKSTEQSEVSDS